MRDGPVRRVVKRAALAVYDLRLGLHRARADIRYELGGACVRCAKCCEAPGIQVSKLVWHLPFSRFMFLRWHAWVNGFEHRETLREERAFVFECTHFDRASRSCDSYESRPGMCRDYPRPLLEQANPELFEGCGYRAVAKNRGELLQILESKSLSAEQMDKLKKGLYLED